jgi:hypothetical protein
MVSGHIGSYLKVGQSRYGNDHVFNRVCMIIRHLGREVLGRAIGKIVVRFRRAFGRGICTFSEQYARDGCGCYLVFPDDIPKLYVYLSP